MVTPGLVLREVKVKEADRIITLLTPQHGIVTASAKGSLRLKNKLFSACGLFCYAEYTLFEGKTMFTVDDAQIKEVFFGLRESIEATSLAMYLAELALSLEPTKDESETQLRLLLNCLYLISNKKKPLEQIKAVYEIRAISESGFLPDLLCCAACGRYDGGAFYFDVQEGKLLCSACAAKNGRTPNLSASALTALRHAALVEDKKIFNFNLAPDSMAQLANVAEQYAQRHLDKPMKTLQFLKTVL